MASETQVAQLAATLIGTDARLVSIDDTGNSVARSMKAVWDVSRRAAIRTGSWNFAARRAGLASVAVADLGTIYPYSYRYPMPAGAVRLIEVLDRVARDAFALEGDDDGPNSILCSVAGPLYIRYAIDIPEPGRWNDDFAEVFAHKVALACGTKIAGSAFDKGAVDRSFEELLARIKTVDAIENPQISQEESDWVTARGVRAGSTFGAGVVLP